MHLSTREVSKDLGTEGLRDGETKGLRDLGMAGFRDGGTLVSYPKT